MTWSHPSTHPPTHQTIHPPMGGEVSTDFKSSNGIEISRLVQVLLNFDLIPGVPPTGGRGWVYGGGGWWEGAPHTCTQACTCTHVHACTRTYDIIGNSQGFPNGAAICMKLSCLTRVCACVCMCVHVHACARVWGGTPQPPPTPSIHPPTPRATGSPKPKFNKSWTNRDNSILFEDSLPLNIPELI